MKKLIILMMLLTLSMSCRNRHGQSQPNDIQDQEQLSVYLADPVEIEGKFYIPLDGSGCISRNYRITDGYIGPISDRIILDLRECHKVIGYSPSEYGALATWMENMRVWLIGFNRKNR